MPVHMILSSASACRHGCPGVCGDARSFRRVLVRFQIERKDAKSPPRFAKRSLGRDYSYSKPLGFPFGIYLCPSTEAASAAREVRFSYFASLCELGVFALKFGACGENVPLSFAEMMAAALSRQDLHLWAEQRGLKLERGDAAL
jgi:hypothetical protein